MENQSYNDFMYLEDIKEILHNYGFTSGAHWYVKIKVKDGIWWFASIGTIPYIPEHRFAVVIWRSKDHTSLFTKAGTEVLFLLNQLKEVLSTYFI